jgi:hypothetical protein
MKRFLAIVLVGTWTMLLIQGCSSEHDAPGTDCRIGKGPCVKTIMPGEITAVFAIRPKPVKMMSALFFDLSLREGDMPIADADVLLHLTMPGMYMGEHKVVMIHKGGGHYEGSGIIPRCRSGKRIWKASFIINNTSTDPPGIVNAEYTFEVKE